MKNPFQNIDNYCVKTQYNRIIRSRTKSKDSNHSSKKENFDNGSAKTKEFIVGVQYRQKRKRVQELQRKCLQMYGPESMRFQPFNYMPKSPAKSQKEFLEVPQIIISPSKHKKISNIKRRDSQVTEMINIAGLKNLQNSNQYGSYYNIHESSNSISQSLRPTLNRQISIFLGKDPFKSFETDQMINSRTKDESNMYQSNYTSQSNRYLQNDHIPDTIKQLSQSNKSNSNKTPSMKYVSDKSIEQSLNSHSSKSLQKSIKSKKISVRAQEYFFSEYYKN